MSEANMMKNVGVSFREMAAAQHVQKTLEQQMVWYSDAAMMAAGDGGAERKFDMKRFLINAGWFVAKTAFYTYLVHRMFEMTGDLLRSIDPQESEKKEASKMRTALEKRLARLGREMQPTTLHENLIAQDLVNPEDILTKFDDIGGLSKEKRDIYNLVCLPLKRPDLFRGRGKLYRPPGGLLLCGLPGTGKTMLAKAIAKESGAAFINLRLSTLLNKYFGESQQLVRALFSLAQKLSPTIIFIDEIDGFLRARSMQDHTCIANMKSEFLALWDGMMSESMQDPGEGNRFGVVIIGASNRVQDIDQAILRRLPRTFRVGLPDSAARENILKIMLRDESLSNDFEFGVLAGNMSEGYSGADLKELCRAAAMRPLEELVDGGGDVGSASSVRLRPLTNKDFLEAAKDVRPPSKVVEAMSDEDRSDPIENLLHNLLRDSRRSSGVGV